MANIEALQPIFDDKVKGILKLLEEGFSREEVAEQYRYSTYRSMDSYMSRKNFVWDKRKGTYVPADAMKASLESSLSIGNSDIEQFLPLLEWLATNKEGLQSLLGASVASGQIPRFTLAGRFVTKSVHMTNTLDLMVRDFSKEKNINQREIFEVALIEFFQKYGYAHEVETLLQ